MKNTTIEHQFLNIYQNENRNRVASPHLPTKCTQLLVLLIDQIYTLIWLIQE